MKYLALAGMVRNEEPYIEEWIKYHAGIGFEEFYIYENDSTDGTLGQLITLRHSYSIHLEQVEGKCMVVPTFERCLKEHRTDARWILFLDCDEFVYCPRDLHTFLPMYENAPGLTVHWRVFGSSGFDYYSPKPVLQRFTQRAKEVNLCCKTFVNPKRTFKCYTSHRFEHEGNPVDERYIEIKTAHAREDTPTADLIQINHYATKSREECLIRRAERRLSTGEPHKSAEEYFKINDKNEVSDERAAVCWDRVCTSL